MARPRGGGGGPCGSCLLVALLIAVVALQAGVALYTASGVSWQRRPPSDARRLDARAGGLRVEPPSDAQLDEAGAASDDQPPPPPPPPALVPVVLPLAPDARCGPPPAAREPAPPPDDGAPHHQIARDFAPWLAVGITPESQQRVLAGNAPARDGAPAVHAVRLIDGLLVFDTATLEREVDAGLLDKLRLFIEQLQSVVELSRRGGVANASFLMTASSLPYLTGMPRGALERIAWARAHAPVLSIAKRLDVDGDVLMPNPYFGSLPAWELEMQRLLRRAAARFPWERRVRKLHWRGACSAKFEGVLPRLRFVLRWFSAPGFDVAFSNQCLARLWAPAKPERSLSREDIKAAAGLHKRRVEHEDFGHYRYLLHLPGASSGSYSRSLQHQVLAGAALLKLDAPFSEFFYSGLVAGAHYLPVNVSSVGAVLRYLRENDDVARALGAAAQRFAARHLSAGALAAYWRQLLGAHAALQAAPTSFGELPRTACVCPGAGRHAAAALAAAPPAVRGLPRCRLLKCDRDAPAAASVAAAPAVAAAPVVAAAAAEAPVGAGG